jgi:hypothetical protein
MQIYSRIDGPERSKAFSDILTWEFTDFEDFPVKYDPLKKTDEAARACLKKHF